MKTKGKETDGEQVVCFTHADNPHQPMSPQLDPTNKKGERDDYPTRLT